MTHGRPARRLVVETGLIVVLAGLTAFAGFRLVASVTMSRVAASWLGVTGLTVCWEIGYLWRNRHANRPAEGDRQATLGVANCVTLTRGVAVAGVAGFVLVKPAGLLAWGPAVLYGLSVTLDAADGFVARTVGSQTKLGERLDHAFDTLGFLVAPIVGVAWGRLPVWYLSLALARYVYRFGLWAYERRGGTTRSLPPPRIRRPLAAIQMWFLVAALAPVVSAGVVALAAIPVVLATLAVFAWDFLYATGRIRPAE